MNSRIKRILCVLMCAALLLCSLGTAAADGNKKRAYEPDELKNMFGCWYYVTSTIPEGMVDSKFTSFYSLWDQSGMTDENVISCEAVFVSGEEALAEAVTVETYEYSDGQKRFTLHINNDALTVPGKAVFQITLETENMRTSNKYTLVVADYNEHPIGEIVKSDLALEAELGDKFNEYEILEQVAVLHVDEAAKALRFQNNEIKNWNKYFMELSLSGDVSAEDLEYSESAVKFGYDYDDKTRESTQTVTIRKFGTHQLQLGYRMGNVWFKVPFTVTARGFAVETRDKALPGGKVQFKAVGTTEGMDFTWSSEGEGAAIDEKTGLLTIDAGAAMGTEFVVKATNGNGEEATATVALNDGAFADVEYTNIREDDGFGVPIPGADWYNNDMDLFYGNGFALSAQDYGTGNRFMDGKVFLTGTQENSEILLEDPEAARAYIEEFLMIEADNDVKDLETEFIEIDGHPVLLQSFTYFSQGSFYAHIGYLYYPRNTRQLRIRAYSEPNGRSPEETPKVSIQDMKKIALAIEYNPETAPFVAADAELTLTAKEEPEAVTAGKGVQFTATFANPDRVNQKNKNHTVLWSVVNADTGEETESATISDRGALKIDRNLEAPVNLAVTATSAKYGTSATYTLMAIPVVQKVEVEPAELFFYVGTEDPQTVKVILTPDTVPPVGITWTPSKKDIVEITETGEGTVSIKPLAAGKIAVAVKEPGGKNARLNVNIVDPVESVELAVSGTTKPGGTVTVKATLLPKTAGNKNLEWSIDVGEDIATITEKGQVKIGKETPSGTKITVTCTAVGAPEPITATTEIEVQ